MKFVVLILLAFTSVILPTTASASIITSATSCTSTYGHGTLTGTHATGFWEQNAAVHHGCGYTGQEHIHCTPDGGVTFKSEFGGPVVQEQLNDTARCPSGYTLIKAGWQEDLAAGKKTFWYFG